LLLLSLLLLLLRCSGMGLLHLLNLLLLKSERLGLLRLSLSLSLLGCCSILLNVCGLRLLLLLLLRS